MNPGMRWILIVVGLLAGNVLAVVILIHAAGPASADRVIPSYYDKAAHFDDQLAEDEASLLLGWKADAVIAAGAVEVHVADGKGAPVAGARVDVTGYQRAHAGSPVALTLVETAPGTYRAAIPGARPGLWDLTVRAQAGHDGFVSHQVVEAP